MFCILWSNMFSHRTPWYTSYNGRKIYSAKTNQKINVECFCILWSNMFSHRTPWYTSYNGRKIYSAKTNILVTYQRAIDAGAKLRYGVGIGDPDDFVPAYWTLCFSTGQDASKKNHDPGNPQPSNEISWLRPWIEGIWSTLKYKSSKGTMYRACHEPPLM
jgi:hypothetical protein